jgi:epidermal growth factor receptor substrate 15
VASQTAGDWGIPPHEKSQFDGYFAKLDPENRGYVTGDQAVAFFSNSRLPEEDLAQIWDLADINSAGQLSRDEFAVAMHLIGQQLSKKGPLPQTLPANLVPPSMRRQAQPPAPAFDVAAAFPKPKTAADDLFGLDAFTTDPQVPQSTGGSTSLTQGSPVTSASPAPQPSQQSSIFKPFAPISSFGQTIVTPQTTGLSASSRGAQQSRTPQSTSDDLLGDTDPEISKKLTQETSELANLSNQVGTLTTQMQQVKSKRASTEQDLSQVNTQKRDFESRLLRLRAAYEQEARDVKSLEVRLTGAKAETAKVQQDLAMVQHTHQGLLEQRQQVTLALDADITENAELKERIRQVNAEISQLKPRLEKMRSDARQQKGLVAINKKQLSTGEAERDKIKADLDAASKEYHDAINELEESKRALQSSSPNSGPVAVASPAPSNTSMNPFFRRTSTMPSERAASQPPLAPQSAATPNQNAFDSLFGPPFAAPSPFSPAATEAPLTAFGTNTSREMSQAAPGSSTASKGDGTPNSAGSSPRLVATKLPSAHDVPPPPPQSRQITSAFLPFEAHVSRSGSPNSSVGVAAPASRFGDLSGFATPTFDRQISQTLVSPPLDSAQDKSPGPSTSGQDQEGSTAGKSASRQPADVETSSAFHVFGQSSAAPAVPGAFPSDTTPFELPINASDHHEQQGPSTSQNDPFIISTEPRSAKDQFDSAFAGFDAKSETPQPSDKEFPSAAAAGPSPSVTKSEFPPIQEFGGEDSDSESERGFDDDFAGASPHQSAGNTAKGSNNTAGQTQELPTDPAPNRPEIDRGLTASSQLPTPNAQQPPPAYQRSTSHEEGEPRESNQFPKEWGGLLPSREGPLSSSAVQNPDALSPSSEGATASIFSTPTSKGNAVSGSSLPPSQVPMAPSATAATSASDNKKAEEMQQPATATTTIQPQQPPAIQPKNVFDDFDHEFDDLTEARPVEDTGDDDFGLGASSLRDGLDAFNPTFDSPVPSRGTTSSLMQNSSHNGASSFHDFETSVAHPTASASNTTHQQQQSAVRVQSPTDWDAIFAGLGSDAPAQTNGNGSAVVPGKDVFGADAFGEGPLQPVPAAATKPALARALTTEHDDPILKRLTGMGYPREESLRALEKFDYNLDKVCSSVLCRGWTGGGNAVGGVWMAYGCSAGAAAVADAVADCVYGRLRIT